MNIHTYVFIINSNDLINKPKTFHLDDQLIRASTEMIGPKLIFEVGPHTINEELRKSVLRPYSETKSLGNIF